MLFWCSLFAALQALFGLRKVLVVGFQITSLWVILTMATSEVEGLSSVERQQACKRW